MKRLKTPNEVELEAKLETVIHALEEWLDEPLSCASNKLKAAGEVPRCSCWACQRTARSKAALSEVMEPHARLAKEAIGF